jgi:class 3 adenylate cyclase
VNLITPAVRERRPLPKIPLVVIGAMVLVAVINPRHASGFAGSLDAVIKLVAILAGASLGSWLEDRIYGAFIGRPGWLRLLVALALPPLALIGGPLLAALFGMIAQAVGDDGTLLLALLFGALWLASAAVGTAIVVLVDVAISAVVPDFRSRVQLAVLSLIALAGGGAFAVAAAAQEAGRRVQALRPDQIGDRSSLDLGSETFRGADLARLLAQPETGQIVSLLVVLVMTLMAVPAILSACGKLADAVMERVHPLKRAFSELSRGNLEVRVEEAGSRDFRELNQTFNRMVADLALSQRMERAFGQYVSGQVLARIRAQHGEATLPATLREATVFFADVRGFTAISERLPPAAVLSVLNRYFERVVAVLDQFEAYLDKFIGDAVVVVFNGPIDQPDHAERAVRCAIAIQQMVTHLNQLGTFPEIGTLEVGIGVATGPLVAGNLGSAEHMEYTVIGDTVNLAARLTGQAPPGEIWVNEHCADGLPDALPKLALSPLSVKGKARPVAAYRVWPEPAQSLPPPALDAPDVQSG